MINIGILLIIIGFIFLLFWSSASYMDSVFSPKKQELKKFELKDNKLQFNGTVFDLSDAQYILDFKEKITLEEEDTIQLSFSMNLGKIVKINEFFINHQSMWSEQHSKSPFTLLEIRQ